MLRRWTFTVRHWIAVLLIDFEEDRTLRAVLVVMLREADSRRAGVGEIGSAPPWESSFGSLP
jgi:hypothetical protein